MSILDSSIPLNRLQKLNLQTQSIFYFIVISSSRHVLSYLTSPILEQLFSGEEYCTSPLIILSAFDIFLLKIIFYKVNVVI